MADEDYTKEIHDLLKQIYNLHLGVVFVCLLLFVVGIFI